jgi:hypothetical protein
MADEYQPLQRLGDAESEEAGGWTGRTRPAPVKIGGDSGRLRTKLSGICGFSLPVSNFF